MKKRTLGCLLAVVGTPILLVAIFVLSIVFQFYRHTHIRERTTFTIPDTQIELGHSRIGIHPFLAEYSRDISFYRDGKPLLTKPLAVDTCGGYPINCYLIESPNRIFLRLDDAVSEHLIDLNNNVVNSIYHAKGKPYYGELDGEDSSAGWSMQNDDPSTFKVTIGGKPANPLGDLIGDAPEKYVGRIDGGTGRLRFVPASEAPEMKIRHLIDRFDD
jgi:hypothetical protein